MKKSFCSVDCRNKRKRRLEASEYPRMKVERTGECRLCGEKVRAPYSAYCEVCAVDRFQKYRYVPLGKLPPAGSNRQITADFIRKEGN